MVSCCLAVQNVKHFAKLKRTAFAEMVEMFDCCLSGQQLTVKSGISGLGIGQFAREKFKRPPMGA
jgi:hypothetical protein